VHRGSALTFPERRVVAYRISKGTFLDQLCQPFQRRINPLTPHRRY